MLFHFAPHCVKFRDEKSFKGQELFLRYVRRSPATGHVVPIMTESGFRNTHSITGFCSMDPRTAALWFRIHEGTNDAEQFMADIEGALQVDFYQRGTF